MTGSTGQTQSTDTPCSLVLRSFRPNAGSREMMVLLLLSQTLVRRVTDELKRVVKVPLVKSCQKLPVTFFFKSSVWLPVLTSSLKISVCRINKNKTSVLTSEDWVLPQFYSCSYCILTHILIIMHNI